MLDIDDYEKLSPEAKKFYEEHEDQFNKIADKWDGFVDMVTIIETATKKGEIEDTTVEITTAD